MHFIPRIKFDSLQHLELSPGPKLGTIRAKRRMNPEKLETIMNFLKCKFIFCGSPKVKHLIEFDRFSQGLILCSVPGPRQTDCQIIHARFVEQVKVKIEERELMFKLRQVQQQRNLEKIIDVDQFGFGAQASHQNDRKHIQQRGRKKKKQQSDDESWHPNGLEPDVSKRDQPKRGRANYKKK